MKIAFIDKDIFYDGSQLRPLYAYENHKILGDSVVSWLGGCDVSFDHMVDYEDKIAESFIKSDKMLHFIVEVFSQNLFSAVALQRLIASIIKDELQKQCKDKVFIREGDDLYLIKDASKAVTDHTVDNSPSAHLASSRGATSFQGVNRETEKLKLSISIASSSAVSSQIHFAMNVTTKGTPVPTASLEDLGLDAKTLSLIIMKSIQTEYDSIKEATQKVKPL